MLEYCTFSTKLAIELKCSDKALILAIIEWSANDKKTKDQYAYCFHHEHWYMWATADDWLLFLPWMSKRTIARYLADLKEEGWIKTATLHPDKSNRTMFYAIDIAKMAEWRNSILPKWQDHHAKMATSDIAKMATSDIAKMATSSMSKELTKDLTKVHTSENVDPADLPSANATGGVSNSPTVIDLVPHIEGKKPRKAKKSISVAINDPETLSIGQMWLDSAMERAKLKKPHKTWTAENYAHELIKAMEIIKEHHIHGDQFRLCHFGDILKFISNSDFYKRNILAPSKINQKWSGHDDYIIIEIIREMEGHKDYKTLRMYQNMGKALNNYQYDPNLSDLENLLKMDI